MQKDNNWSFTIPQANDKRKRKFNPQLLDLEIITRDLSQYLTKTNQGNDVERDNFVGLMVYLNSIELEMIEKLMIMNLLPRSLVLLYAIIEECEDRFGQEKCEEIISCIDKYFPVSAVEGDEDVEMENDEENEEFKQSAGVEDDEDEDQFVQDDELEHESHIKRKSDEKEIDEVEN